jgi:hypothetical protein
MAMLSAVFACLLLARTSLGRNRARLTEPVAARAALW